MSETISITSVRTILPSIAPLLIGYGALQIGNGLQGSLLAIRAEAVGFDPAEVGLVAGGFWIGMILGAARMPKVIEAVGHVRTFAALASLASAAALLHFLFQSPLAWIATRALTGICFSGLFICVESWLSATARSDNRGRVFALYGMTGLLCGVIGQSLLTAADPSSAVLFCLVSVIISCSLVPIALAGVDAPVLPTSRERKAIAWRTLFSRSPFGFIAAPLAGVCAGSFFGLGPFFAVRSGMELYEVALFMGFASLGAFIATWPLGRLSDVIDRRLTIALASGIAVVLLIKLSIFAPDPDVTPLTLRYLFAFSFGALIVPAYSIIAAHINDRLHSEEYVPGSGKVLTLYGAGSAVGPVLLGALVSYAGDVAFPLMIAAIQTAIIIIALSRFLIERKIDPGDKVVFVPNSVTPTISSERAAGSKE